MATKWVGSADGQMKNPNWHEGAQKFIKSAKEKGMIVTAEAGELNARNPNFIEKVMSAKQGAEKALQNYGKNIRKNIDANSADFEKNRGTKGSNNYQTKNPFPNPLKRASYE